MSQTSDNWQENSTENEQDDVEEDPTKPKNQTTDSQKEDPEVIEPDVVEEDGAIKPAEEVSALSTFTAREGHFNYKLIPSVTNHDTEWRVVVYADGVQGSIYDSYDPITDESAETMGMSEHLQQRLNDALLYSNDHLDIPPEMGDQQRDTRSLSQLEREMDKNDA